MTRRLLSEQAYAEHQARVKKPMGPLPVAPALGGAEPYLTVQITPLRLYSTLNQREHWAKRAKRAKNERAWGFEATRRWPALAPGARATVTITRIAPRKLDSDNLAGSAKSVRDGVADRLQVNDGDERITWLYGQEKGAYAVRIVVERA